MKPLKSGSITIRIRETLKKRLELVARLDQRSLSHVTCLAIEQWVFEAEEQFRDDASISALIDEARLMDAHAVEQSIKATGDLTLGPDDPKAALAYAKALKVPSSKATQKAFRVIRRSISRKSAKN